MELIRNPLSKESKIWEDQLLKIIQFSASPMLIVNPTGTVLVYNSEIDAIFGLSPNEGMGGDFFKIFIPEAHQQNVKTAFDEVLTEGAVYDGTFDCVSQRANKLRICWKFSRLVNEFGRAMAVVAAVNDLSEIRRLEEQLKDNLKNIEDQKEALDKSAIVAITDAQGNITYANKMFCEISHYSPEELIGKNHRIINSGFHPKDFFINLWSTISSGQVWRGEVCNRAKDGSIYWVDTTVVPFLDHSGKIYRYVSIRYDITAKKLSEKLLEDERSRAIQAEKMASLGEMAAGIAHELGNPLATIHGRMELLTFQLQQGPVELQAIKDTASTVLRVSDRMTRIIRGMRVFARDGSGDPFKPTSIKNLITEIIAFSGERLKKVAVDVREPDISSEVFVECRETQIMQVLLNLISNSCDALKNEKEKWIHLDVVDGENEVQICVTDSGPGIPEKLRSKIMTPFFTTKKSGEGTGLGLSIAQSIANEHQGTLKLNIDSPNTQFILTLPKRRKIVKN